MAIEQEWWKNKLAEDIYATLKLKEQTLPTYYAQSPQLCVRRHLVDWLSVIVGELDVCATAQHLAIYLLDVFMDGLEVEQQHCHLVALVCLLIAVKFEDHCDHIPHFSKLNSYIPPSCHNAGQTYTAAQYLALELTVLKFVDWNICVPTVPHFLPYFLKVAVDEDDLKDGLPITSKPLVETYLEKHSLYFQEVSLQDHQFRDYAPSLVAASCVASARICLHLSPVWPKQMELMTDYYLEELLPCVNTMLGIHQKEGEVQPFATVMYPYSMPVHSYVPSSINRTYAYSSGAANINDSARNSMPVMQPMATAGITLPKDTFPSYLPSEQYRNYLTSSQFRSHLPSPSNFSQSYLPYSEALHKQSSMYVEPMTFPHMMVHSTPNIYPVQPSILPGCRGS